MANFQQFHENSETFTAFLAANASTFPEAFNGLPVAYVCEDGQFICGKCAEENKPQILEAAEFLDKQWNVIGSQTEADIHEVCANCGEHFYKFEKLSNNGVRLTSGLQVAHMSAFKGATGQVKSYFEIESSLPSNLHKLLVSAIIAAGTATTDDLVVILNGVVAHYE